MYQPGDVILVKNLTFRYDEKDHAEKGRFCIVLYTNKKKNNKESVVFLTITSKDTHNHAKYELNGLKMYKYCSLDEIHTISADDPNISSLVKYNVGKEYLKIVEALQIFHKQTHNIEIKEHLYILGAALEEKEYLKNKLSVRKESLKEKKHELIETKMKKKNYKQSIENSRTANQKKHMLREKQLKQMEKDCYLF